MENIKGILMKIMNQKNINTPIMAFNVNDQFDMFGVFSATYEEKTQSIILISSKAIKFSTLPILYNIFETYKNSFNQKIYIQLDHAKDINVIKYCIDIGFDIIMADFSDMGLNENIARTKEVVDIAHETNVLVEGELGIVPTISNGNQNNEEKFTNPDLVHKFIEKTHIDFLAVSVGNKHGISKMKPAINYNLIYDIARKSNVPIVLHGADFLSNNSIKKAIEMGIGKINFGPELRDAYLQALKSGIKKSNLTDMDHRPILNNARKSINQIVQNKLKLLSQ
jgi:fructose-bisphosphate aldolase, class II